MNRNKCLRIEDFIIPKHRQKQKLHFLPLVDLSTIWGESYNDPFSNRFTTLPDQKQVTRSLQRFDLARFFFHKSSLFAHKRSSAKLYITYMRIYQRQVKRYGCRSRVTNLRVDAPTYKYTILTCMQSFALVTRAVRRTSYLSTIYNKCNPSPCRTLCSYQANRNLCRCPEDEMGNGIDCDLLGKSTAKSCALDRYRSTSDSASRSKSRRTAQRFVRRCGERAGSCAAVERRNIFFKTKICLSRKCTRFAKIRTRVGVKISKKKSRGFKERFVYDRFIREADQRFSFAKTSVFWYSKAKNIYTIVRPLLNFLRCNVTMACRRSLLPVYPDLSNLKMQYSRNRIRKQIVPTIKVFLNPKMEKALFAFLESYNLKTKQRP